MLLGKRVIKDPFFKDSEKRRRGNDPAVVAATESSLCKMQMVNSCSGRLQLH